jgi:hypothetical protein
MCEFTSNHTITKGYRVRFTNGTYILDKYANGSWGELTSGTVTVGTGEDYYVRVMYTPCDVYTNGTLDLLAGLHDVTIDKREALLGVGGVKKFQYQEFDHYEGNYTTQIMLGAFPTCDAEFDCITYGDNFWFQPEYAFIEDSMRVGRTRLDVAWSSYLDPVSYYSMGDTVEYWATHLFAKVNTTNASVRGRYIETVRMFDGVMKRYEEVERGGAMMISALDEFNSGYAHGGDQAVSGTTYFNFIEGAKEENPLQNPQTYEQAIYQRFVNGYTYTSDHYNVAVSANWTFHGMFSRLHKVIDALNGVITFWSPYGFTHTSKGPTQSPYIFDEVNMTATNKVPMYYRFDKKANYKNGHINHLVLYYKNASGNSTYVEKQNTTSIVQYRGDSYKSEMWLEMPEAEALEYADRLFESMNVTGPLVTLRVNKLGYDLHRSHVVHINASGDERLNGSFTIVGKIYYMTSNPSNYKPPNGNMYPGDVEFLCVPYNGSALPMQDWETGEIGERFRDAHRQSGYWL